jgi:hypothetical protein
MHTRHSSRARSPHVQARCARRGQQEGWRRQHVVIMMSRDAATDVGEPEHSASTAPRLQYSYSEVARADARGGLRGPHARTSAVSCSAASRPSCGRAVGCVAGAAAIAGCTHHTHLLIGDRSEQQQQRGHMPRDTRGHGAESGTLLPCAAATLSRTIAAALLPLACVDGHHLR